MSKQWDKDKSLVLDDGHVVEATAPFIISASRSTDIPAFYADWFFYRLKKGYSVWRNPFNGADNYVSYKNTNFIVFWSKNPKPLIKYLPLLKERGIEYYIQYTLNDYVKEGLEPCVPQLNGRIDTFKRLIDQSELGRVIWRFDPLILTDKINIDNLLEKISNIATHLHGYTEKLVFSFADILEYRKVKANLEANHINYYEWTEQQMIDFAKQLCSLNKQWNFRLATCGEKLDLQQFGIEHNHCVDDELMIRFGWRNKTLMDFLGVNIHNVQPSLFEEYSLPIDAIMLDDSHYALKKKDNKDKGQRQFCGCMISKDIGQYNTCPHQCEYCYANTSKRSALENFNRHLNKPFSETISGI